MHFLTLTLLCLMLIVCPAVSAQESTQNVPDEQSLTENDQSVGDHVDSEEKDKSLQKRKLEIGIILTAGIFLVGMFLVVVTLIYGRRTRRQLAAGRGPSKMRDELWYLKNASEQISDDDRDESQEDTK